MNIWNELIIFWKAWLFEHDLYQLEREYHYETLNVNLSKTNKN